MEKEIQEVRQTNRELAQENDYYKEAHERYQILQRSFD